MKLNEGSSEVNGIVYAGFSALKTLEGRLFNLMYPILYKKCTSERHKRSSKQALKDAVRLFRKHRGEATPSTSRVLFEAGGVRITIPQVVVSEARAIGTKSAKALRRSLRVKPRQGFLCFFLLAPKETKD